MVVVRRRERRRRARLLARAQRDNCAPRAQRENGRDQYAWSPALAEERGTLGRETVLHLSQSKSR